MPQQVFIVENDEITDTIKNQIRQLCEMASLKKGLISSSRGDRSGKTLDTKNVFNGPNLPSDLKARLLNTSNDNNSTGKLRLFKSRSTKRQTQPALDYLKIRSDIRYSGLDHRNLIKDKDVQQSTFRNIDHLVQGNGSSKMT